MIREGFELEDHTEELESAIKGFLDYANNTIADTGWSIAFRLRLNAMRNKLANVQMELQELK